MPAIIFFLLLPMLAPARYTTLASGNPVSGCSGTTDSLPYYLEVPTVVINLVSEELKEISGLSATEQPGIFCTIADEKGEILFIDGNGGGAVLQRVLFREKGDFEGVEKVDDCLYAMKSNGEVYEVSRWEKKEPKVAIYKTPLSKTDDVEGLGYDHQRKALLLACKGNPDSATLRKVYAFDLRRKQLSPEPVFTVDPLEVNRIIAASGGTEGKHHFFSPSGIAVHPINGDVYILSSAMKCLVVLDYQTGAIKFAVRLDKKLLPQPEGISFDSGGNLYLSSEGKMHEGLLLRFDYKK